MLASDVKLISVDDHVVESGNVWVERAPRKFADVVPRLIDTNATDQAWTWEGRLYPLDMMGNPRARTFRDGEEGKGADIYARSLHELSPACYDVHERVKSMDIDGVHASLNFPTFPRFAATRWLEGQDMELAMFCVTAWNDWMLDEWVAAAPDRFIPMTVIPLWDPHLAADEMRRCAAKGARSITMCENPAPLGLPSFCTDHWDPVFAAAEETGMVLSMHIGTSGSMVVPSQDSGPAVPIALCGLNSMSVCAELIFGGILNRFPTVRIALSEGGAGWAPYLIERMDYTWERTRHGVDRTASPSELFHRHFWACFIWDETAIYIRDLIGVDKLMWECDFPHNDSNWPDSRKMLEKAMVNVPDDVCRKIGETNARALYDFPA